MSTPLPIPPVVITKQSHIKTMFSMQSRKAIVAGIMAALATATLAAENGITLTEALTIAGAFVAAFQATYWTNNTTRTLTTDGGYTLVEMAFALLIIVIALVLILRFIR